MAHFNINLIRSSEESFGDKLLYFIFHYFRYILVLTQITVVGVFFFRFTVDQSIIDAHENINNSVARMKSVSGIIKEAQEVEDKIKLIKNHYNENNMVDNILSALYSSRGTEVKSFSYQPGSFTAIVSAPALSNLQELQSRLRLINLVKSVNPNSLQKKAGNYEAALEIKW